VAINAVLINGTILDPIARLGAQAERVRAYLANCRPDCDVADAQVVGLRDWLAPPFAHRRAFLTFD
jgi:hypothetical protein